MEARVNGFTNIEVTPPVQPVYASVPRSVVLTLDLDEFVALTSLWANSFDGHDGPGGLRMRIDKGFSKAWSAVLPGISRSPVRYGHTADATSRALDLIEHVKTELVKQPR